MKATLRFLRHLIEMVIAVAVGMVPLGPLWNAVLSGVMTRIDARTPVMATNMTIGMALWMHVRQRYRASIAVHVGHDRGLGDAQRPADLGVGQALADQAEHLDFARRQVGLGGGGNCWLDPDPASPASR